jgi:uncharacterized protein (DUF1684 family)
MKNLWPFVFVVIILILFYTFFLPGEDKDQYRKSVIRERQKIERFMKDDPDSPFRKKGEIPFRGLEYFEIDPDFRVEADVTKLENPERIELIMSDGSRETYFKYAIAEFTLMEVAQRIVLLKSEDHWNENWVFLPFYDETSTEETYGGGRYLDITYSGSSRLIIDFNLSYNPYCAYTDSYRCPFPPPQNQITVKVTAGEKVYRKTD